MSGAVLRAKVQIIDPITYDDIISYHDMLVHTLSVAQKARVGSS